VLKLEIKGTLEAGKAADVLVMTKADMELREVISLGRRLMKEGQLSFSEKFLKGSNRKVTLEGEKNREHADPPKYFAAEKARTAYVESLICEGK